jgi:hypothetical protein
MSLAEKIRRAREQKVEAGGFTFTVRRPTELEMFALREHLQQQDIGVLMPFVVDWKGVQELDLIPGGNPIEVPFDAETCAEWLADNAAVLNELAIAIIKSYQDRIGKVEAAKKA